MYNPTEQIAEINKTNVAQATKFAALSLETAEKFIEVQPGRRQGVFAQSVESAQALAAVKDVQDLLALRTKFAEAQVQSAVGYSRNLYELATEAQAGYSALAEESFGVYTKGVAQWVDQGQQVGARRFGRRRERVQVDDRRDHRRVRPVPEGDEASREPRRCERPRRRGDRDEGRQQGQARVSCAARERRPPEEEPALPTSKVMSPSVSNSSS